jgi:hypothetical protein
MNLQFGLGHIQSGFGMPELIMGINSWWGFLLSNFVDYISHFKKDFPLSTVDNVIVKFEHWKSTAGTSMVLPRAWFQIRGIPRNYRNKYLMAYDGSMVGSHKFWMQTPLKFLILLEPTSWSWILRRCHLLFQRSWVSAYMISTFRERFLRRNSGRYLINRAQM